MEIKIKYASVLVQIKAVITDIFMLIVPLMYLSIYIIMGNKEAFQNNMLSGWSYIILPYIIVSVLFLIKTGQTPGLKAYELKLISKNNTQITLLQIIIRQLLSILTTISLIGLLLPFFRTDRRTIHDIIASTVIVSHPNKSKTT